VYLWCYSIPVLGCSGSVWPAPSAQERFGGTQASLLGHAVPPAPLPRIGAAALPNPSIERDLHRNGTWPARRFSSSSVSRAKHHSGSGPSAQTLGSAARRVLVPSASIEPGALQKSEGGSAVRADDGSAASPRKRDDGSRSV
jgi:hypothetical protein